MSKKERIKSFNPAIALLPDTKHYNNLLNPVLKDKCSLLPIKGHVFDLFWMESTIIMNPMVNECLKGILICLKWFLCPQINQLMIVEQYNRMYVLVLMLKMQSREHCNIVARCIFNVRKKKKNHGSPWRTHYQLLEGPLVQVRCILKLLFAIGNDFNLQLYVC